MSKQETAGRVAAMVFAVAFGVVVTMLLTR
jgi:hypothetical protein